MKDTILFGSVVAAFASLVTAQVAIAFGLGARTPRWHGIVALFVPLAAPILAWRAGMRTRAALWAGAAGIYVAARVVATFV